MSLESLVQIVLVAVSYYLFSNEFFRFTAEVKRKEVSFVIRFISFLIIYVWFMIASVLELPLVVNWIGFLILLGLELHFVFVYDYLISYTLSLFCVIIGLAVNVFFRSLMSIVLRVPLNVFDRGLDTLKVYPIFLGFMSMVLLLSVLRYMQFALKLEKMLLNKKSLNFYACIEVCIYLFLVIQLLLFTQSGDTMGIKTWGIKSSLFSVIILFITSIYSLRVASLHYYMDKQHEIRSKLIQEKEDINKLWKLAYTDILTGCDNRQLLDKRLQEYAGYGGEITLAFIDVNGLKIINDQYGHLEGDQYLISVANILTEVSYGLNVDLFRYGGDEFVMMSNTLQAEEITELLVRTNEILKSDNQLRFNRSVSYGVVHGESTEFSRLIEEADDMMYKNKLKHYEKMVRA